VGARQGGREQRRGWGWRVGFREREGRGMRREREGEADEWGRGWVVGIEDEI